MEEHLFTAYLPAVYQDGPAADRARQWLGYLARHLDALGSPDLAWWRLRDTVPRAVRVLVLGLAAGLAVGIVLGPVFGGVAVLLGFVVGLAFGPMAGLPATGPRPARTRLDVRGQLRPFVDGVASGLTVGLVLGVVLGVLDGFEVGVGVGLVAGVVIGLAVWLTNGLESPVDVKVSAGVSESLVRDRRKSVWQSLAVGAAIGASAGIATGVAVGGGTGWVDNLFLVAFAAVPIGIIVGIPAGLIGAWGQWLVLARLWLPLTGHLPWRLNAFPADAYQRGVLRQAGSVYQFRHGRLKNHLAGRPGSGRAPHAADAASQPMPYPRHARDDRRRPEPGRS